MLHGSLSPEGLTSFSALLTWDTARDKGQDYVIIFSAKVKQF